MEKTISIARDYTRYPGPRYDRHGPNSGERFRDQILIPALQQALKEGGTVTVLLDGVSGFGSSFLEEAFGGLVRKGYTAAELRRLLRVAADTDRFQHHVRSAEKYIKEAAAQALTAA